MSEELMTVEEAASRLGVSPATVRRRCASGELLSRRVGRGWLIPVAGLPAPKRSSVRRRHATASGLANLPLALQHLLAEDLRRNVWVPDIIRWEDDLSQRDALLASVALRLDRIEPFDAPVNVPVPKSPFFLRNALNLTLIDRIGYQAAVAVAAPAIEKATSANVFSARLSKDRTRFLESGTQAWVKWMTAIEKRIVEIDGWVIETDVTSYFDCISHTHLLQDLQRMSMPSTLMDALREMLRHWAVAPNTGIPQGPDASRLLGNLYMLAIDDVMLTIPGITYFRYMDDIRIVAASKHQAVTALKALAAECLRRNLVLSTKKTELSHGAGAVEKMKDRLIDEAAYAFEFGDDEADTRMKLRSLFRAALGKDGLNARRARFSIFRLRSLREEGVLRLALKRLEDLAPLGILVPSYLLPWLRRPWVGRAIAEYLMDPERNTSDYLSTWLLCAFIDEPLAVTGDILEYSRRIAFDRGESAYHRAVALNIVARSGRPRDVDRVKEVVRKEYDPEVVRASLVGLHRAGQLDKTTASASARISGLASTVAYLKGRADLPALIMVPSRVPVSRP